MTRRICFFGGPGTSKSTLAAWLFAMLKMNKINTELVTEYIKAWTFIGRAPTLRDQTYICAKQLHREDIVLRANKDVVIVSDSPLFLGSFYAKKFASPGWQHLLALAQDFDKDFPSLNILIDRGDLEYKDFGRFQTRDQAIEMDNHIKSCLDEYGIPYETLRYDDLYGMLILAMKHVAPKGASVRMFLPKDAEIQS